MRLPREQTHLLIELRQLMLGAILESGHRGSRLCCRCKLREDIAADLRKGRWKLEGECDGSERWCVVVWCCVGRSQQGMANPLVPMTKGTRLPTHISQDSNYSCQLFPGIFSIRLHPLLLQISHCTRSCVHLSTGSVCDFVTCSQPFRSSSPT